MNSLRIGLQLAVIVLLTASVASFGQSAGLLPLDQVKPGMTGYGKTIFQGVQVEEFQVEILGVLENIRPQQNMILARLGGDLIEKTGVFAGMSGSPVYVDGRLVGAVAYSFAFSKEPIAGITPIAEMVDIFERKPGSKMELSSTGMNPASLYRAAALPSLLPTRNPALEELILDTSRWVYNKTLEVRRDAWQDEQKSLTEVLNEDLLKKIREFCVDHAADSEQPMTCG